VISKQTKKKSANDTAAKQSTDQPTRFCQRSDSYDSSDRITGSAYQLTCSSRYDKERELLAINEGQPRRPRLTPSHPLTDSDVRFRIPLYDDINKYKYIESSVASS